MRASQTQDSYWRGLLQRKGPRGESSGFVSEALNVYFPGGVPASRPGLRVFHGVDFPDPVRGHAWHVAPDGLRTMLVAAGTKIYSLVEGGDPVELVLTGLPADSQTRVEPEVVNFLSLSGGTNTTFIFDGVNPTIKFDGSSLSIMGIEAPPVPLAAVSFGAGNVPPGTRTLVQTLVSSTQHESNPSTAISITTTVTSQQFTIPSPTRGPGATEFDNPYVDKWRVYMTVAGGAAPRFVDEADIGVNIVVNLTDATLGERKVAQFDVNDPPPAPAVAMAEHRGQLAAVFNDDLGLVRFSNLDPDFMVPEGWPEDFVQPVTHADGDELTALASLNEWLVVFKTNGTYAVVGESFEEYRVVPVLAAAGGKRIGAGTFNPGCVLQVENALFFVARDGIYKVDRFASPNGGIIAERLTGSIDDLYAAAKFSLGASTFFDRIHRLFGFPGHG